MSISHCYCSDYMTKPTQFGDEPYLLEDWVTPMVYMALRCIGAALIFWLIAAFLPKEKVEKKDLLVIMLGGLTGFVISQTLTAWSLNPTLTPLNNFS